MSKVLVATKTFVADIDGPRFFHKGITLIEDDHPWFKGPLGSLRSSFAGADSRLTYPKPGGATTFDDSTGADAAKVADLETRAATAEAENAALTARVAELEESIAAAAAPAEPAPKTSTVKPPDGSQRGRRGNRR